MAIVTGKWQGHFYKDGGRKGHYLLYDLRVLLGMLDLVAYKIKVSLKPFKGARKIGLYYSDNWLRITRDYAKAGLLAGDAVLCDYGFARVMGVPVAKLRTGKRFNVYVSVKRGKS